MARTIGQARKLEFGGLVLEIRVSWEAWKTMQDAVEKGRLDDDVSEYDFARLTEAVCLEFCKASVTGWSGMVDADGNAVEYDPELLAQEFAPQEIVLLQNAIAQPDAALAPNLQRARNG